MEAGAQAGSVAMGKRSVEESQPQGEKLEGMIRAVPEHTLTILSQWNALCLTSLTTSTSGSPLLPLGHSPQGTAPTCLPTGPGASRASCKIPAPASGSLPNEYLSIPPPSPMSSPMFFFFFFFPTKVTLK